MLHLRSALKMVTNSFLVALQISSKRELLLFTADIATHEEAIAFPRLWTLGKFKAGYTKFKYSIYY